MLGGLWESARSKFSRQKSELELFYKPKRRALPLDIREYEEETLLARASETLHKKKIFDAPCIPSHPFDPSSSGSVLAKKRFIETKSKRARKKGTESSYSRKKGVP